MFMGLFRSAPKLISPLILTLYIMKKIFLFLLLLCSFFVNAQVINKAEYFIDTDPGQGNGVNIPIGTNGTTVSFTASVSTTGLSEGFHNLNIRTRLADGHWGHYENRVFYLSKFALEAANVKAAEFFIDADPGNGNGTAIPVATIGATTSFVAAIPTTGLTNGFHNLIIRTKNELGQWGLGENRVFYISSTANAADITAAEFFIDTDPGTGNATTLAIGASGAVVNFIASIPTASLANGFHNLFIRTKDSQGIWGHFENRVFYVSNQGLPAADISAIEYFIDSDPGVGNGVAIPLTSGSIVTLITNIPTSGLTAGKHFLFLRAKSADGWGGFEKQEFTIGAAVAPGKPIIVSVDAKTPSPILTSNNKPVILGTAEPNATVEVFNGATSVGTFTANATGNWTFTPTIALADGVLNITTKAKNSSNLESAASDIFIVTIDTKVPLEPIILSIVNQTNQNFTTNVNRPLISGKGEAGSTIEIFNGSISLGFAVVDASGKFTFTPTASLPDGLINITTRAKDVAGNTSSLSSNFAFTVDTQAPSAPVIINVDGKTTQNFTTTNNKPIITGTAEPGTIIEFFNGTTSLGFATVAANGGYTFTPTSALPDGNYVLTLKTKDAAGNVSAASANFNFSIDATAPNAPVIVSVDGKTTQNFATSNNSPVILATTENLARVELFNGSTSFAIITANATGGFTFTPTSALPDGNYVLTARATDAAGNVSVASASFSFSIDTSVPLAPVIVSVDGKTTQNFTTANNRPSISGTAEISSNIELFNGANSLGTASANATGGFTFTPLSALPDGNYILTAKAKDSAGNLSLASTTFSFAIDTKAPNIPVIVSVDGKTISPAVSTNLKPILIGTAEAGSAISIFNSNTLMGTVTANGTGNWSFTPQTELAIGTYNFVITAKDATDNESARSNVFVYDLVPVNKEVTANNVLTPNGDGKNDYLLVENLQYYPKSLIRIYDRAGRIVFTANAYKNDWSGDLNGTTLAEGTYYYMIDLGDGFKAFKSFITIVRQSIR